METVFLLEEMFSNKPQDSQGVDAPKLAIEKDRNNDSRAKR